jgi:hypothetical protein
MVGIAVGVIVGLAGFSALAAYLERPKKEKRPSAPVRYVPVGPIPLGPGPAPLAPAASPSKLVVMLDTIIRIVSKLPPPVGASKDKVEEAAAIAISYGMPKTAQAIRSDSGLPRDEVWPGTRIPVLDYIKDAWTKSELYKRVMG